MWQRQRAPAVVAAVAAVAVAASAAAGSASGGAGAALLNAGEAVTRVVESVLGDGGAGAGSGGGPLATLFRHAEAMVETSLGPMSEAELAVHLYQARTPNFLLTSSSTPAPLRQPANPDAPPVVAERAARERLWRLGADGTLARAYYGDVVEEQERRRGGCAVFANDCRGCANNERCRFCALKFAETGRLIVEYREEADEDRYVGRCVDVLDNRWNDPLTLGYRSANPLEPKKTHYTFPSRDHSVPVQATCHFVAPEAESGTGCVDMEWLVEYPTYRTALEELRQGLFDAFVHEDLTVATSGGGADTSYAADGAPGESGVDAVDGGWPDAVSAADGYYGGDGEMGAAGESGDFNKKSRAMGDAGFSAETTGSAPVKTGNGPVLLLDTGAEVRIARSALPTPLLSDLLNLGPQFDGRSFEDPQKLFIAYLTYAGLAIFGASLISAFIFRLCGFTALICCPCLRAKRLIKLICRRRRRAQEPAARPQRETLGRLSGETTGKRGSGSTLPPLGSTCATTISPHPEDGSSGDDEDSDCCSECSRSSEEERTPQADGRMEEALQAPSFVVCREAAPQEGPAPGGSIGACVGVGTGPGNPASPGPSGYRRKLLSVAPPTAASTVPSSAAPTMTAFATVDAGSENSSAAGDPAAGAGPDFAPPPGFPGGEFASSEFGTGGGYSREFTAGGGTAQFAGAGGGAAAAGQAEAEQVMTELRLAAMQQQLEQLSRLVERVVVSSGTPRAVAGAAGGASGRAASCTRGRNSRAPAATQPAPSAGTAPPRARPPSCAPPAAACAAGRSSRRLLRSRSGCTAVAVGGEAPGVVLRLLGTKSSAARVPVRRATGTASSSGDSGSESDSGAADSETAESCAAGRPPGERRPLPRWWRQPPRPRARH